MKYEIKDLIDYERERPSLHSLGLITYAALSSKNINESEKQLLLLLRNKCLKLSTSTRAQLANTLPYIQAITISKEVLSK